MISFNAGKTLFTALSQNTTAQNATLYGQLANIEHRYLLQKYFANEGSFQITTVGATALTLTSAPAINAVSATLVLAWAYPTCDAIVTFSDGEVRKVSLINGSTAITWQGALTGTQFALTTTPAAGDTSATLSTAWSTATQTSTSAFSDASTKSITYTLNSASITWAGGLTEAQLAYVNTSVMTTAISISGIQFYPMPPNYSQLKTVTITVGSLQWTLNEVRSREEWDKLNVFPYYASIPQSYFIYPGGDRAGQIGIWPIPSSTGNLITFNYKFRVPDLSLSDYGSLTYTGLTGTLVVGDILTTGGVTATILSFTSTNIAIGNKSAAIGTGAFTTASGAAGTISVCATVSVSNGGVTVTGTSTSFISTTNRQMESRWIQFLQPDGDGLWYQIRSVDSTTSLTLYQPYQGITVTTSAMFIIGQMPLLAEDFQDLMVWKSLQYYFSSIVDNPKKAEEYGNTYQGKLKLLGEYSGSNTIQVNLSRKPQGRNPNLFQSNIS